MSADVTRTLTIAVAVDVVSMVLAWGLFIGVDRGRSNVGFIIVTVGPPFLAAVLLGRSLGAGRWRAGLALAGLHGLIVLLASFLLSWFAGMAVWNPAQPLELLTWAGLPAAVCIVVTVAAGLRVDSAR